MANGGLFAMGQAVPVRADYTASEVRRFARRAKDGAQARRLLALAAVLDGASREEARRSAGWTARHCQKLPPPRRHLQNSWARGPNDPRSDPIVSGRVRRGHRV